MVLADGTEVDLGALGRARVTSLIGQGGQGYVYEVRRDTVGEPLALKWYKPESATTEQHQEMQQLVEFGSPHRRFLWPMSMARVRSEPGFGYVMQLRDPRFLELSYLLVQRRPRRQPARRLLRLDDRAVPPAELQLPAAARARALLPRHLLRQRLLRPGHRRRADLRQRQRRHRQRHAGGCSARRTSWRPRWCSDTTYRTLPNTDTDRHSLAVLLFYSLFLGHPLEGDRTDAGAARRPVADDPLRHRAAVLHAPRRRRPTGPREIVQQYWNIYPQFLRDLFVQAFVDGIDKPGARVTEGQWIKAMDRLRDGMLACPTCGTTNFWDPRRPRPVCRQRRHRGAAAVPAPGRPARPSRSVRWRRSAPTTSRPAWIDRRRPGRPRQHPQVPDRWGLHNASDFPGPSPTPAVSSFVLDPDRPSRSSTARGSRSATRLSVRRPATGAPGAPA